jgi:DNA ligase-1
MFLAETFENVAEEPKRLKITALLSNAYRTILATSPDDLLAAVYLRFLSHVPPQVSLTSRRATHLSPPT